MSGTSDASWSKASRVTKILVFLAGSLLLALVLGAALLAFGSSEEAAVTTTETTTVTETTTEAVITTMTTVGPDASSVAGEAESQLGTLADPYPIGDRVPFSYDDFDSGLQRQWQIEVLDPVKDLTQQHLDENEFNAPPAVGEAFATVRIRVTYLAGPTSGSLSDIKFGAVGPSGKVLSTHEDPCGVSPDELDTLAQVLPGQSLEGTVCWAAPSSEVPDLKLILESAFSDDQILANMN